ncbi:MAG: hypothetical protein ACRDL5_14355, partial [Solirubrobacteraceae bacterium]
AGLLAREGLVSTVKGLATRYGTRASVQRELGRELGRCEHRGETARRDVERRVRSARTGLERQVRAAQERIASLT